MAEQVHICFVKVENIVIIHDHCYTREGANELAQESMLRDEKFS